MSKTKNKKNKKNKKQKKQTKNSSFFFLVSYLPYFLCFFPPFFLISLPCWTREIIVSIEKICEKRIRCFSHYRHLFLQRSGKSNRKLRMLTRGRTRKISKK